MDGQMFTVPSLVYAAQVASANGYRNPEPHNGPATVIPLMVLHDISKVLQELRAAGLLPAWPIEDGHIISDMSASTMPSVPQNEDLEPVQHEDSQQSPVPPTTADLPSDEEDTSGPEDVSPAEEAQPACVPTEEPIAGPSSDSWDRTVVLEQNDDALRLGKRKREEEEDSTVFLEGKKPKPTMAEETRPASAGTENGGYPCTVEGCERRSRSPRDRERHLTTHNIVSQVWICPNCQREFNRPDALSRHFQGQTMVKCLRYALDNAGVQHRKELRMNWFRSGLENLSEAE